MPLHRVARLSVLSLALLAGCGDAAQPTQRPWLELTFHDQLGRPYDSLDVVLTWWADTTNTFSSTYTTATGTIALGDSLAVVDSIVAIGLAAYCDGYLPFRAPVNGPIAEGTQQLITVQRRPRAVFAAGEYCGSGARASGDAYVVALTIDSLLPVPRGRWQIAYLATRATEYGELTGQLSEDSATFTLTPDPGGPACNPAYTLASPLVGDSLQAATLMATGGCYASSAPVQLYQDDAQFFP